MVSFPIFKSVIFLMLFTLLGGPYASAAIITANPEEAAAVDQARSDATWSSDRDLIANTDVLDEET
ncbi:hypothetical protein BC835DRAFT_1337398 [Cytidiella melzeri]|nr:hypothetical protein BC835DRAFT_1337398 [Cytidiella melzeri]